MGAVAATAPRRCSWYAAILVGAAQLGQPAWACDPIDARGFGALLAEAERAIANDDVERHLEIRDRVYAAAPCLTQIVDSGRWAEFLVGEAAVRYLRGEDWHSPLASALSLDPGIDRGVGPTHEIAQWVPPPPPPPAGPAPRGGAWYVDGAPADALPAPNGLHLVQLVRSGAVRSAVVEHGPVPQDWLAAPGPAVVVPTAARLGLWLGAEALSQRVTDPGTYADDTQRAWPHLGLSAAAALGRPVRGAWVGARTHLAVTTSPAADGSVAVGASVAGVGGGLGGALVTGGRVEGVDVARAWIAAPIAAAWLDHGRWDAGLELGLSPSLTRGVLRAGARGFDEWPVRAGIDLRLNRGSYVQAGTGRSMTSADWSLSADLGWTWGAR